MNGHDGNIVEVSAEENGRDLSPRDRRERDPAFRNRCPRLAGLEIQDPPAMRAEVELQTLSVRSCDQPDSDFNSLALSG